MGFDTAVILPATHDTGSAFLAVPARDQNAVCLSSGTWSLLGVENERPVLSEESRRHNFTNEGGAWYRYRYLKNIMGLWMLQCVRRELSGEEYVAGQVVRAAGQKTWNFGELAEAAAGAQEFCSVVSANDEAFLAPKSMISALKTRCAETGQPVPQTVGELMQCVYRSLAGCYREGIRKLESLTGKRYTSINIVGGGCQDETLNQMTANAAGLPVYAGPVEGTALGNLMVQMIAAGEFDSLQSARSAVKNSFTIKEVLPC